MKKNFLLLITILFIAFINIYSFSKQGAKNMNKDLSNKKVVMIIANEGFRDEEYLKPKAIFEKQGMKVVTSAHKTDKAIGKLGAKVKPDISLEEVKVSEYDVVVFVGGPGSTVYVNDKTANAIIHETLKQNKILAAICAAPAILAHANVLVNKNATSFPADRNTLKKYGAKVIDKPVVVDGNIITSDGPQSADIFAETIVKALLEKK
jgi:protease I